MNKRRVLLALVVLAIGLIGVVVIVRWSAPSNVTSVERFEKITVGMTEAEVIVVLGNEGATPGSPFAATLPKIDHRWRDGMTKGLPGRPEASIEVIIPAEVAINPASWKEWRTPDNHRVAVGFDHKGRVAVTARLRLIEDWPSKIRRWLGFE